VRNRKTIPISEKRRQHSLGLKAHAGLDTLKGIEAIHAIAAKFEIQPVQVNRWKKEAAERHPEVFAKKADHDAEAEKERKKVLFEKISRIGMKLEWLQTTLAGSKAEWPPNGSFPHVTLLAWSDGVGLALTEIEAVGTLPGC
jgi:transposase-like protein